MRKSLKWHNLMMKCREEGCPTIHVKPCENLSKVLKDVCNITCNAHLPVVTDFQNGFVIPADTDYYDAYFMAIEQTDDSSAYDRLDEARMIKKAIPNFKFDEELKINLAYYRSLVLKENPQNIEQFTQEDLLETYSILSKMKNADNRIALPILEKELQSKYPDMLKDLQQKEQSLNRYDGITR